jgi:heme exporter protein A
VIVAAALEKRYGASIALRPVSFNVPRGGFLVVTGRNGAGKSTLLRLITGLAAQTGGDLAVGVDREEIGYLGHEPMLYGDLTVVENLELFGRLYRVDGLSTRLRALIDRFDLASASASRVATLSRGMTQRLALCRALLHDPTLIVLDEPHTALDTTGAAALDKVLGELAERTTIVVASHDPGRLEGLETARLALA